MAAEPFQSLSQHARQYTRLDAMFRKWHEIIKRLPAFGSDDPRLLASMTIGEIGADGLDANSFAVTLAGTTLYIRLNYLPGGEHGTDGILQPYVREPVTEKLHFLAPIPFKGNGATQVKLPNGDQLALDEQEDAFSVIGRIVKAAIERK